LNTASEVGYGNVVKTLSAFAIVQAALLSISDNPLITSAIATNVLAGITGSASGGMSIALGAMGETFYQQALAKGINPEVLHRVVAIACGGLDSLPHNGAVVTLLGITQITHKEGYADVGMVSVVIPVLTCVIAIILGSIGIV
ncbi:MAG: GntP family permease, partial [Spirochaetaceae bacterium]|nr:GntP family permease [Spirochaetaceae bacterium]